MACGLPVPAPEVTAGWQEAALWGPLTAESLGADGSPLAGRES